jgi:hypothetical protein
MKTILALAAAASVLAVAPPMTLDEFIASASAEPEQAAAFSCWQSKYPGADGEEVRTPWRHNLTTTTATGYTNALDWLAKAMGAGPSSAFATAQGNATSTGTTSLTAATGFPTSGQGLAGCIVVAGPNASGTGAKVYGVIVSNTATVLTVDQWYDPTSTTGAAGSTPNGTCSYVVLPGQNPAPWMAVTANVFSPATSDVTLAGELASNGFSRAVGTYAHTAAASTYTLVHLWTATGTETITNEAQFGACNVTGGGVMPFESPEPSSPTLVSGDTLQNTATITI